MRAAIKLTADFWYTAWVDAGQPDLSELIFYTPSQDELKLRRKELEEQNTAPEIRTRAHEI
jgi:hypothetical protein